MVTIVIIDSNPVRSRNLSEILGGIGEVGAVINEWTNGSDLLGKLVNVKTGTWLLAHARNISDIEENVSETYKNRIVRYSADGDNVAILKLPEGREYREYDWKSFFEHAEPVTDKLPLWILIRSEFLELIERFAPLSLLAGEEEKETFIRAISTWLEKKKKTKEWEKWKERISVFIEIMQGSQAIVGDLQARSWRNGISGWLSEGSRFAVADMVIPIGIVRGYL